MRKYTKIHTRRPAEHCTVQFNSIRRPPHRRAGRALLMMAAASSSKPPANLLAQIRRHSQVIVDTADYQQLEALPLVTEATTNPSIVWAAAQQDKYFHLLEEACNVRTWAWAWVIWVS